MQCCYREQLSYALYTKFREPKLFRMAVTGDWDMIPARCRSHPKEATFVHKYPPADTALHRMLRSATACSQGLDSEAVQQMNEMKLAAVSALLEVNPQASELPDSFGRTPLHLACMDVAGAGVATAALILEVNPDAAMAVDSEQRTPLHYLIARNETIPMDFLSQMLERCPSAVFRKDVVGDTPIDCVEQRIDEIDNAAVVLALLKAIPDAKLEQANPRSCHNN